MSIESDKGVIYFACGQSYIQKACVSAESVKCHMPGVPTVLFTHQDVEHPAIDTVIIEEKFSDPSKAKLHKIESLARTPYSQTLFLDTDTYLNESVVELFELLTSFDIGVAHASNRLWFRGKPYPSDLPESFPEFNTGVMVYNSDNKAVKNMLKEWRSYYVQMRKKYGADRDQISFREVIYSADIKFTTLTPKYNCRIRFPIFLDGQVCILHAHHEELSTIGRIINRKSWPRTYQPWMFEMNVFKRLRRFVLHLKQDIRAFVAPWF